MNNLLRSVIIFFCFKLYYPVKLLKVVISTENNGNSSLKIIIFETYKLL